MFDRDPQPHRSAPRPESGRSALRHDVRRRSARSSARSAARNGIGPCVRRRDRHGIVLVFVVVLLVLLAIMGTAFLAVSRADRQNVIGRGASADGAKRSLLRDTSLFERLHALTEERVKQAIVDDLFGNAATKDQSTFRQGLGTTAARRVPAFTSYGAHSANLFGIPTFSGQSWLASLTPILPFPAAPAAPQTNPPRWNWISSPLDFGPTASDLTNPAYAPFNDASFADPRDPTRQSAALNVTQRIAAYPTAVQMQRTGVSDPGPRLYPGMQFNPSNNSDPRMIAADADGDGIADSMLTPMVLDPTRAQNDVNRYLDRANNCIYFYAIRVVDNSAKVNVNTALSARSDYAMVVPEGSGTPSRAAGSAADGLYGRLFSRMNDTTANTVDFPNLGVSRSNVGLLELFDGLQGYYSATIGASIGLAARVAEVERLLDVRVPGVARPDSNTTFDAFAGTASYAAMSGVPTSNGQTSEYLRNDIGRAIQLRTTAMPLLESDYNTAQTGVESASAAIVTQFETLRLQSLGDYIEHGVLRRAGSPGPWGFTTGSSALSQTTNAVLTAAPNTNSDSTRTLFAGRAVDQSDDSLRSLAARGSTLLSPYVSQSLLESTLSDTTYYNAANFGINKSNPWTYFPPNETTTWFNWTQDFRFTTDDLFASADQRNAADFPYALAHVYPARTGQSSVSLVRSLRPLLTTLNGVAQVTPVRTPENEMAVYGATVAAGTTNLTGAANVAATHPATRVSAATAPFQALYRAYFGVTSQPNGAARRVPGVATDAAAFDDSQLFRWGWIGSSALSTRFDLGAGSKEMAKLRAALLAANTVAMRRVGDGRNPVTVSATDTTFDRDIPAFKVSVGGYDVRVYGVRPHPYITEVIASPGNGNANTDLLYIELFNPYPFPIDLAPYRLAAVRRETPGASPVQPAETQNVTTSRIRLSSVATSSTSRSEVKLSGVLPAGGYIVVGYGTPAGNALTVPATGVIDATALKDYIRDEIVLYRTRRGDGEFYQEITSSTGNRAAPVDAQLNETELDANATTLVPLDLVDLRTLPPASVPDPSAIPTPPDRPYFEYRRATSGPNPDADRWRCVYAGPFQRIADPNSGVRPSNTADFDPTKRTAGLSSLAAASPGTLDVLALRETTLNVKNNGGATLPRGSLGSANVVHRGTPAAPTASTDLDPNEATFVAPVINLYHPSTAYESAGYRIPISASPYGTPFARDGDLINVPFIGSYVITRPNGDVVEIVPMTVDAVVADNSNGLDTLQVTATNPSVGRLDTLQSKTGWATDLTTFVTARGGVSQVLVPELPPIASVGVAASGSGQALIRGADAPTQGAEATANPARVRWVAQSTGGTTVVAALQSIDVSNSVGATAARLREGLVNINTAPVEVLQLLPWVVDSDGKVILNRNRQVASLIAVRQTTPTAADGARPSAGGAILTLDELRAQAIPFAPGTYGSANPTITTRAQALAAGDVTPYPGGADLGDYKRNTLNTTRLSNLATTRSDVFTVYVTVQAWTYYPSSSDQANFTRLIAEKRSAFVVDRSTIGPSFTGSAMTVRSATSDLKVIDVERD